MKKTEKTLPNNEELFRLLAKNEELGKAHEQLIKSTRLAVIGQLAAMIGHDLRNPLTSIIGSTYYLEKKLDSNTDSKLREMLGIIKKNVEYSNKIVNDLIDYSREIVLEPETMTPKAVMKETLRKVKIPKTIRLVNLTKPQPKMKVDLQEIKCAFSNLLTNAVDAMPQGGALKIESKRTGDSVIFTFSDTGTGISPDAMEKLWTPLFTTKAKGMGFGLAICKRIVEAHGGSVSVKSKVNRGTTFTVKLPIEPKANEGGEKAWMKPQESSLLMTMRT